MRKKSKGNWSELLKGEELHDGGQCSARGNDASSETILPSPEGSDGTPRVRPPQFEQKGETSYE